MEYLELNPHGEETVVVNDMPIEDGDGEIY